MKAYKFSECATKEKPDTENTALLEKAMQSKNLNRAEKDRIAEICYGVFGSQFAGYKLAGWKWDLHHCLNEYIIQFTYGRLQSYFAGDKTALRKVLNGIDRIIAVGK